MAVGAIVATGAARVILLIDYPSDTIAAAAIAIAWALLVCLAFDEQRSPRVESTVPTNSDPPRTPRSGGV
ncbi:MAG: hypothetical protein OEP52_13410 [Acidimicrobiia bacterium]|nr:hypothetical protein [Acidimicrobiia bacterium]